MYYKLKSKQLASHWVHLVKGPSTVSLQGIGQVLGKDVSNSKVSVGVGKILPFEIGSGCKINISGGESWLAHSSTAGTSIWQEIIQKILCKKASKTILIVGDTDTGKSTLAVYIINEALKNGFTRCCVIDADIGQGDIAPPNAIGAAVITKQITDLRDINGQFFEFVGSINPIGFEGFIIKAIKNILRKVRSFCDICIINTDGYIQNNGINYKIKMANALRPDFVVCLGEVSVFNRFRAKFVSSPVMYGKSTINTIKSKIDRNKRRLNQFLRYTLEEKDGRRSDVTFKDLKEVKFVYKGKTYSKIRATRYGSLHLANSRNSIQIKHGKLANMFVALGSNSRSILGFGIILNVSRSTVYIKSDVRNYNTIYLSNSGISEDNTLEFRIFNN
jgi:polynucleotide 5'-hydroxyl-kinase GRC3/NOL9